MKINNNTLNNIINRYGFNGYVVINEFNDTIKNHVIDNNLTYIPFNISFEEFNINSAIICNIKRGSIMPNDSINILNNIKETYKDNISDTNEYIIKIGNGLTFNGIYLVEVNNKFTDKIDKLNNGIISIDDNLFVEDYTMFNKYSALSIMNESLLDILNEKETPNTLVDEREAVLELIKNDQFEVNKYSEFSKALYKSSRKSYLSEYTLDEFKDMTTYKVEGYDIGYAIKSDGDIVSVFNNSGIKGIGKELVKSAIRNGGTKLDHFDGFLSDFYEDLGFKEYMRYTWDDQYAPKDWDYEKDGRPDVIMRKL